MTVLKIDPTHADSLAHTVMAVASQHRAGEFVEVTPGEPGSGLVNVVLRPLDPDAPPRVKDTAYGSMA